MTQPQRALVRYWMIVLGIILLLVIAFFWIGNLRNFRWVLLAAMFVAAVLDRSIRPPRPADAKTALEIVQGSRAWTLFFFLYALAAVFMAVFSATHRTLGSWLLHNAWLLGALIIGPILLPVIQSELILYKELGNE